MNLLKPFTRSVFFQRANYYVYKEPVILTNNAIIKLKDLVENTKQCNSTDNIGIRLSAKQKECGGHSYFLNYVNKNSFIVASDDQIKKDDMILYIDNKSMTTIIGTKIDYVENDTDSKFIFSNPNKTEKCSCEQSFVIMDQKKIIN